MACLTGFPVLQHFDDQAARIEYLEATVHHLAVLAIAQSQQYEDLSQEVTELRTRVNSLRPLVH